MRRAVLATSFLAALLLPVILRADAQTVEPRVRNAVVEISIAGQMQLLGPGSLVSGVIESPLSDPDPFLAIGAGWVAEPGVRISLMISPDGRNWSQWFQVSVDPHHEPNELQSFAGMVIVDRHTRYLRFRADSESGAVSVQSVRLNFISPGATTGEMGTRIRNYSFEERTAEQMQSVKYPKPKVVSRTEWGCPDGQVTTHGTLAYTTVTHLIVHHTADLNTLTDWPAVVRSIWNFHIFTNGWSDIGYNYLIDPNGVIYEGRSGGDNVMGAHFSGVNGGTMGVSMLGTYTSIVPTDRAMFSLRKLLAWKADQRAIDPTAVALHAASGRMLNTISGHRDGPSPTECPGAMLYGLLPALRNEIRSLLTVTTPVVGASAANYKTDSLAAGSIVAAYGSELAGSTQSAESLPLPTTLAGASVIIRDNAGIESFAPLFFVSSGQINLLIPENVATGPATIQVLSPSGRLSTGSANITRIAPGLFSADSSGKGLAAAFILRVRPDGSQIYEPVAGYDQAQNRFVALPIDLGSQADDLFLVLFGTGFRFRSALSNATARVGGSPLEVVYAGPASDYAGLDQMNVRLNRSFAGRGQATISITVDGIEANTVYVVFK